MGIEILILSHKRAVRATTHRYVEGSKFLVAESQADAYRRAHPDVEVLTHPDSVYGMSAKREWTRVNFGDQIQLDDDSVGMYRIWRPPADRKRAVCSPATARDVIEATAETARELGAYLWGFGSHAHPLTYRGNRPFKFGGYTPSGAVGLLAGSRLFWPPDCTLPIEDYWICLLNAYHHRFGFYDCRFAFAFANTYTGQGGNEEFRTATAEQEATDFLRGHFGDAVQPKGKPQRHGATKRERNPSARTIRLPYRV